MSAPQRSRDEKPLVFRSEYNSSTLFVKRESI